MKKYLKNNGLSLVFFLLFILSFIGQLITGLKEHNKEMEDAGGHQLTISQYIASGHFLQSTFENWESEFLQMALFVILSVHLYQKGSSESKDPDKQNNKEEKIHPGKKDAPWPVKKGGLALAFYKHSLSCALFLIFILSFLLHWYGSMKDYNEMQLLTHKETETALEYLSNSRFWFESFQNWESEFLSIFAIVVLSIYLREQGSAQSKPLDASTSDTGV